MAQTVNIDRLVERALKDVPSDKRESILSGIRDALAQRKSLLEEELIFGASRRERRAWGLSLVALLVAGAGAGLGLWGMSQTETRAYLAIVDKDTGVAERAVTVERAVIDQSEAVLQSLLHGYVVDRETFDDADNVPRINDVFRRSRGAASASLQQLWNIDYPEFREAAHPPVVYGSSAKVRVDVLSITALTEASAQVRFTKTLDRPGEATREGKFVAVLSYVFKPETRDNLELVWENPFGFYITDYRITAEVSLDDE